MFNEGGSSRLCVATEVTEYRRDAKMVDLRQIVERFERGHDERDALSAVLHRLKSATQRVVEVWAGHEVDVHVERVRRATVVDRHVAQIVDRVVRLHTQPRTACYTMAVQHARPHSWPDYSFDGPYAIIFRQAHHSVF